MMEDEGYPLSSKAQAMIVYLVMEANKNREIGSDGKWRFPRYVEIKQGELMRALKISRRETLYSTRDELVDAGYLLFVPGIGSQSTAYIPLPIRPDDWEQIKTDKARGDGLVKLIKLARYRGNSAN